MSVSTLLGFILDQILTEDVDKEERDGCVFVTIEDGEIIDRIIVPLCGTYADEYLVDSVWLTAKLKFGENPNCHKGELQSITLESADGDIVDCEVGETLLDELSAAVLDDVYFTMCSKIMF